MLNSFFTRVAESHIKTGHLYLTFPDGSAASVGDGTGGRVAIRITDSRTVRRMCINPELALGEAFMEGTLIVDAGSIYDFLELLFRNTSVTRLNGVPRLLRAAFGAFNRLTGYNSVARSKSNVAHHYDLNGELYRLFLDSDSQYSCGYFEDARASLEAAQLAKKRHLAAKMALLPGQRVLDIGSGWGGLGLYLAAHFDAQVDGVTLSQEQFGVSNARARAAGLNGNVSFDLKDYRDITQRYDRIVSVGMFEHVGRRSYAEFFAKVHDLLTEDGVMLLHYIGQTGQPSHTNPWILKYIFPGGHMPALSEVLPVIERHGLVVTDLEVLRLHYAETLRDWRQNFMARRDEAVVLYDERFARMWEFYLAASETAFRHQGLVVHQIQLARRQDAVPLTRDYIGQAEARLRDSEVSQRAVGTDDVPAGEAKQMA
ncbi:SAM-dependent methyltransferase [Roseicitreum antarcticum]|nr:cyclopropane-fatty-acyl-phospholipid synthase family protein [Roseicitreum antarcticum]